MAYFTSKDEVVNKFTMGNVDIALHESDWDPDEGDGENMFPGYTVYKNPTVKNTSSADNGEEPVYCRLIISIEDEEGNRIRDQETLNLIRETIRYDSSYSGSFDSRGESPTLIQDRVPGYCRSEIEKYPMVNPLFEMDEKRSEDNRLVFNYKGEKGDYILNTSEEATLFTHVVIPIDWSLDDVLLAGDFNLIVSSEAIQCAGFTDVWAAYDALDQQADSLDEEKGGDEA